MNENSKTTAREYLRVSEDSSGELRSPAQQHQDNVRRARANGWQLAEPYAEDEAISASRYSKHARPGFDALRRDLESGQFGADVLILWESSRGSRRVSEWVALIEACENSGVLVHVTKDDRTYDPANPRDRHSMIDDANDSEYESAKTSVRVLRAMRENAAAGRPHGKTPYGYTRTYDPGSRQLVSQDPDPDEAKVITELYDRLRAGHSLRAIARDFDERGIRTRGSKGYPPRPFSPQYLRDLALRPCYGGLRVHQAGSQREKAAIDGATGAMWPALVDAETWHAVHRLLTSPARRTSRGGRAKWLLSGIAQCGVCAGPLSATERGGGKWHDQGRRDYQCRVRSCVRIAADDLDDVVTALMLDHLAQPEQLKRLRAGNQRSPQLDKVRADLETARGDLQELQSAGASGKVSVATLLAVEPGITARIEQLEARERELSAPSELAGLLSPGDDVQARWDAAPVSARRQVARLLLRPGTLGTLMVDRDPHPGRGQTPAQERVRWQQDA